MNGKARHLFVVDSEKQALPVYDDISGSSESRLRDFALASADWFWEMDQGSSFRFGLSIAGPD